MNLGLMMVLSTTDDADDDCCHLDENKKKDGPIVFQSKNNLSNCTVNYSTACDEPNTTSHDKAGAVKEFIRHNYGWEHYVSMSS